jgi:hypothetical protein
MAFLYSSALSVWSISVAMVSTGYALGPAKGGFNDLPTFLVFLKATWFAGLVGLVFSIGPYARYRQAYAAAKGETAPPQPPPEQNTKVS